MLFHRTREARMHDRKLLTDTSLKIVEICCVMRITSKQIRKKCTRSSSIYFRQAQFWQIIQSSSWSIAWMRHQGSWQSRGDWREVRESGQEWESTPFVFSSFTSLFNSYEHAFRHDAINPVFVRTFYYNVTAILSPRCVRSSRQRTGQTRRSPALSYRGERARNSNSKEE